MRILQFGKFYPPVLGGIEKVMQDLCDGLRQREIICDVLCSNSTNHYQEDTTPYGAKIYRTASLGKIASTSISPQMIIKLKELIDNYDIIHIHLPDPMATLALFLSNHKNKKIIIHWHSDIINQKFLLNFFLPLQSWILNRADKIIATSEKYILESPYLQRHKKKCVCIPIGIDFPTPTPLPTKQSNIILSVGRLVPLKGFEYLIKSALYLPKHFQIHIIGDGKPHYKLQLQTLINSLKLQDRVFLLGAKSQEKLKTFYQQANCFVLPSLQESYGIVLLEAMASGLPLVCTKLSPSGSDWINQDRRTGFVVPPKDPQAITQAILKIQEEYEGLSEKARNRFQSFFTKEKMIEITLSLYYSV
ncbi:glycosyltransferase [Helicobacter brantae]|uniref:Glycosyl transferase family 1 n=1 Tax=Helicobacter brantae TaxID=375927 RepID=A0A3D8J3S2_9HELI|nr:glycosyltransferase [Helicobacter brantae]RDU72128.1 glycosyl transferase family 1 [Helicobacter brantae]